MAFGHARQEQASLTDPNREVDRVTLSARIE